MPVNLKCRECGSSFSVKPSRANKAKYCSLTCHKRNIAYGGSNNPNWRGGLVKCQCQVCGKAFERKPSAAATAKYCSRDCKNRSGRQAGENHPSWKGGSVKKYCAHCGNSFSVTRARINTAKYCSYICLNRGRNRSLTKKNVQREKECRQCGRRMEWNTEFRHIPITTFEKRQFCSNKCAVIGQTRYEGKSHPLFKSDARRRDRRGKENAWRKQVLARDRYRCQECGANGRDEGVFLVAHHIIHFATNKQKRWDIDNGQTLCVKCHGAVHGFKGYPEISDDELIVKIGPRTVSRRVEVECSWCSKPLYKAASDLIHYPSRKRKKYHFCNKNVCMKEFYAREKRGETITGTRVVIEGKAFKSYGAASKYYGITVSLISTRINRQGLTPEQAVGVAPIPKKPNKGREICIGGTRYPSLKLACTDHSLPYGRVKQRLRKGWTVRQAFEIDAPPYRKVAGRSVTVDKTTYPSIRDACDAFNISYHVVLRRRGLGWTTKRALKTPVGNRK